MVKFNKETHAYSLSGRELISVTQLLKKHHLSSSYQGVNEEQLKRAADYGTLVHKELEEYITLGKEGFTDEFYMFKDFYDANKDKIKYPLSERVVYNEMVAGTVDFIYYHEDDHYVIADFKTTSKIYKESVSWQLSLYAYLYDIENYDIYKLKVFHFGDELEIVDIVKKPIIEIEKLLECEANGKLYLESSNLIPAITQAELVQIENKIALAEMEYKKLEKQRTEMLEKIKLLMEENMITSIETDNFKITYVAPIEKESIDVKKLKDEQPEIADKYTKKTITKSQIRFKLKEKKDE